ncbi:MAG: carbohydrate kinase, partial [Propionibacterium sp.]
MSFVVCGEALVDLIPSAGGDGKQETIWRALSGGGPLNTATALARLGEKVEFLGRFGRDSFAIQLRNHLLSSGVALNFAIDSTDSTSLAVVSLDDSGKASYTFHFAETANFGWQSDDFPELKSTDWLHFGSVGAVLDPGADLIADFVANTPAKLSYDINIRPAIIPDKDSYRRKVTRLLKAVGNSNGVIKASDEDIELLLDDRKVDPTDIASSWIQQYGAAVVVVTLGENGALAVTEDQMLQVSGHKVDLVDTVGAGDTFMAGFLAAYSQNPKNLEYALSYGVAASAIVCTRQGANPPTKT